MTNAEMVAAFHRATGLPIREAPVGSIPTPEETLRLALIEEEYGEYEAAIRKRDVIDIADALADLLYVVYGTAHAYGIPIDEVFAEVHRSNMTKLVNGTPMRRDDGKILKGPQYQPPNIKWVLERANLRKKVEEKRDGI